MKATIDFAAMGSYVNSDMNTHCGRIQTFSFIADDIKTKPKAFSEILRFRPERLRLVIGRTEEEGKELLEDLWENRESIIWVKSVKEGSSLVFGDCDDYVARGQGSLTDKSAAPTRRKAAGLCNNAVKATPPTKQITSL